MKRHLLAFLAGALIGIGWLSYNAFAQETPIPGPIQGFYGGGGGSCSYAYVQKTSQSSDGTNQPSVATPAWPGTKTAGNLLYCVAFYSSGSSKTITMSGGDGASFQEIGNAYEASVTGGYRWYYAANIPAGTTAITATYSANVDFPALVCAEYSGFDTSAPFTSGETASQLQANPSTGTDVVSSGNTPALASQPRALIGFSSNTNGTVLVNTGTSFSSRTTVWNFGNNGDSGGSLTARLEDRLVTSTSAVAATFTKPSGSDTFYTIATVLKCP